MRDPFVDGPAVIISGRVAALLNKPLARLLREARDQGVRVDDEVLSTASAIERASREYVLARVKAGSETGSDSGTRAVPITAAPSPSVFDGWLSTSAVADRIGCSERYVVRLIHESRLTSRRLGRAHLVDPVEVERFLDDRARERQQI